MSNIKDMHYTICLNVISSSGRFALPPLFGELEQRGVEVQIKWRPRMPVKHDHWRSFPGKGKQLLKGSNNFIHFEQTCLNPVLKEKTHSNGGDTLLDPEQCPVQ